MKVYCKDDGYNPVMLLLIKKDMEAAEYLLSLDSFPKHWSPFYLHSICEEHEELISRYHHIDEKIPNRKELDLYKQAMIELSKKINKTE